MTAARDALVPLSDAKLDELELGYARWIGSGGASLREKHIFRALTELRQRRAADEWQPIETALQNQRVLIWCGAAPEPSMLAWTNFHDECEWPDEATHWRPLPAPPHPDLDLLKQHSDTLAAASRDEGDDTPVGPV